MLFEVGVEIDKIREAISHALMCLQVEFDTDS